ncbi:quinone oxidoreductase family protein [Spirosoma linguale]|uniref:Alcohol dehydrogenase zinc-binding domain protein n=1 Tax=Spirosoma linguale (strain ATCC 33905 / DSM 74 / LMG 10896 / Claus 1) TaxID=504472 RepID=D2QHM7_SPILD|nr:Alcohol dehydrogenase zinc-binding domain protein [Spirosoma linguale DSM 74]
MKAAIMYPQGDGPRYAEVPSPVVANEDEVIMTVKAAAIKHIDRGQASGNHYSADAQQTSQAKVIGGDGVGLLADGTRVYAMGVSGMVAQQAVVEKKRMVLVPDGLDDATAAALPNGVIGAAMALRFRAGIQPGDVVLINGATGFTGRVAVQIAKYYGAKKVIATGRNPDSLQTLLRLGADEIISVNQSDEEYLAQIRTIHSSTPVDVIIDYLWGHSAELLLTSLKGKGAFTHPVRFVSIGSITGDKLQLSAENLRSVNLQLSGSGLGSWTRQEVGKLFSETLPEMFQLAADGKLKVDTVMVDLSEIESIYNVAISDGKRLVITMN